EFYAFLSRDTGVAVVHAMLDLDRVGYCIHDALKLNENTVTSRLHDATAILLVLGVDQLSAIFLEAGERTGLIRAHQPAITRNIGGEDGGGFSPGPVPRPFGA